jgi:hypothetical protein
MESKGMNETSPFTIKISLPLVPQLASSPVELGIRSSREEILHVSFYPNNR